MASVVIGLAAYGIHEVHKKVKARKETKASKKQASKEAEAFYSSGANLPLSHPPPPYETQPPQYTTETPLERPQPSSHNLETQSLTPAPLNIARRRSESSVVQLDDSSSIYSASDDGTGTRTPPIPSKSSKRDSTLI